MYLASTLLSPSFCLSVVCICVMCIIVGKRVETPPACRGNTIPAGPISYPGGATIVCALPQLKYSAVIIQQVAPRVSPSPPPSADGFRKAAHPRAEVSTMNIRRMSENYCQGDLSESHGSTGNRIAARQRILLHTCPDMTLPRIGFWQTDWKLDPFLPSASHWVFSSAMQ